MLLAKILFKCPFQVRKHPVFQDVESSRRRNETIVHFFQRYIKLFVLPEHSLPSLCEFTCSFPEDRPGKSPYPAALCSFFLMKRQILKQPGLFGGPINCSDINREILPSGRQATDWLGEPRGSGGSAVQSISRNEQDMERRPTQRWMYSYLYLFCSCLSLWEIAEMPARRDCFEISGIKAIYGGSCSLGGEGGGFRLTSTSRLRYAGIEI